MATQIQMVDLRGQYNKIRKEVEDAISEVLSAGTFINGPQVKQFSEHLAGYLGVRHVIPCGNGTDALQIALMALGLNTGDEVIVPAFTYVATAEVIGLLGLTPVMVDVDYDTFNVKIDNIEKALTPKTRAIVPVHLFGQSCDMAPMLAFAAEHGLYVVEDNAQAIGAEYRFRERTVIGEHAFEAGTTRKTGTMGHIGCTSFFPSKNLGCYGDGGALMTDDDALADRLRMIANHGQRIKYHHDVIGCNSRLDTLQAAILDIKLKHLDEYGLSRREAARYYTSRLKEADPEGKYYLTPEETFFSSHVYHQYTLKIRNGKRDGLQAYLKERGIPSMIYYPLPLQEQKAFQMISRAAEELSISSELSRSVLSLPMHTELDRPVQDRIVSAVRAFFSE